MSMPIFSAFVRYSWASELSGNEASFASSVEHGDAKPDALPHGQTYSCLEKALDHFHSFGHEIVLRGHLPLRGELVDDLGEHLCQL